MSQALRELQESYNTKLKFVQTILREAKQSDGNLDLRKSQALRNLPDDAAARQRMKEIEQEVTDLLEKKTVLEQNLAQEQRIERLIAENNEVDEAERHRHGGPSEVATINHVPADFKSLGQRVSDDWPKKSRGPNDIWLQKHYDDFDVKAVMTTVTGFPPEVTRTGRVAEYAHRAIQVTDMFPVGASTQAGVSYMEETTSSNTAAEVAEGAAMPQSDLAWTERTVLFKKIAAHIAVTDEQLADVAQVQTLIDQRLRFFVQQRLDLQLMVGNGVGANLTGILNVAGIQTYARGAETNMDAIFRAMALVQVTGRANVNGIIVHPTNWTTIRLATANGIYLFGPPSEAGITRLWGVPIAVSDTVPLGTAVVGDFAAHATLYTRQGVEVMAGLVNDDLILGQQRIRATLRAALVVYRPAAFATVTNLN